MIKGKSANELFINVAKHLKTFGKINSPRGLETIELQNAWLLLSDPRQSIVTLPARGINYDYLKKEMEWYLSGNLSVTEIAKASSFWLKLADSNGTVNSNYGFLALVQKWSGKSQLEWCVDCINDDPDTRQAVINYNQPVHKYKGNKDFVCTIAQLFRNNDGKLDTTVLMRSNDMIRGLTYDLPWFTHIQARVAHETGLGIGKYRHFAASFHVYKEHFDMLDKIASSKV